MRELCLIVLRHQAFLAPRSETQLGERTGTGETYA
jgi:hypothetical protein